MRTVTNFIIFISILYINTFSCLNAQVITTTPNVIVEEKDKEITLTFKIDKPADKDKYIFCKTYDNTASEINDYHERHNIIRLPKGEKEINITIPIVQDNECERIENFIVEWSEDLIEDAEFNNARKYWKNLHTWNNFENLTENLYGGKNRENMVVEVDHKSQGYQDVNVIKGVKHRVSFITSRREHEEADDVIELNLEIKDLKSDTSIISKTITRDNKTFQYTEEHFFFQPNADSIRLIFSTKTNEKSYGIILDKLSIVPVFNEDIDLNNIKLDEVNNQYIENISHGFVKVNIIDCGNAKIPFKNNDFTVKSQKNNNALNDIIAFLKDNEQVHIDIVGHTDCRGSEETNLALSMKRATATKEYIIHQGVASSRILKVTGKGESEPFVPCDCSESCNDEINSKNRRVEVFLIRD